MGKGLLLKETMSGWIRFYDGTMGDRPNQAGIDSGTRYSLSFTLRAFTPHLLSLTVPRDFYGEAIVSNDQGSGSEQVEIEGTLTLFPSGPKYEMHMQLENHGSLYLEGKKAYSLFNLKQTLVTCPLKIYQDGREIGDGEVAYRDSLLKYPFKSLSLIDAEDAYELSS